MSDAKNDQVEFEDVPEAEEEENSGSESTELTKIIESKDEQELSKDETKPVKAESPVAFPDTTFKMKIVSDLK